MAVIFRVCNRSPSRRKIPSPLRHGRGLKGEWPQASWKMSRRRLPIATVIFRADRASRAAWSRLARASRAGWPLRRWRSRSIQSRTAVRAVEARSGSRTAGSHGHIRDAGVGPRSARKGRRCGHSTFWSHLPIGRRPLDFPLKAFSRRKRPGSAPRGSSAATPLIGMPRADGRKVRSCRRTAKSALPPPRAAPLWPLRQKPSRLRYMWLRTRFLRDAYAMPAPSACRLRRCPACRPPSSLGAHGVSAKARRNRRRAIARSSASCACERSSSCFNLSMR